MESAAVAVAARAAEAARRIGARGAEAARRIGARVAEAARTAALAARRTAAQAAEAPQPADVNVAGAAAARTDRARVWAVSSMWPNRQAAIAVPVGPSPDLPADARPQVALPAPPTRRTGRCRCSDAIGRRV